MKSSDVRKRVLDDHRHLRGMLSSLEDLAKDVRSGRLDESGALRERGEGFLELFGRHMSWEDRHLAPVLRRADESGEARAILLFDDHREQRILLEDALARIRDAGRPAALLAENLLDLVALIRGDMADEESWVLDECILRDDVSPIGRTR